jgi:hypothetical protein
MTPRDIVTKHIMSIEGIRIPFARIIIDRIFADFKDYGYTISESDKAGDGDDKERNDNGRLGTGNGRG